MYTTFAYGANYTAAQTDADMPMLADVTIPVDGANHPLLPIQMYGRWFYALGNTLSRVRISAPKFRPIARPLIRPIEQAVNPSSRPIYMEAWRMPLLFRAVEAIAVLVSNNAPTGGERNYVIASLGDRNYNVPQLDMYTIRLTSSFTPTANVWTASGLLTFDDQLAVGKYAVIGFEQYQTTGVAARLVPIGLSDNPTFPIARPGILVPTANGSQHNRWMRYGTAGTLITFESIAPPQIEVLQTGATTNPDVYLDVVQVRQGGLGGG